MLWGPPKLVQYPQSAHQVLREEFAMSITVEAIYENGVFKPQQPISLPENQKVRLTIDTQVGSLSQAYGIIGWKGSAEDAERFALDKDLEYPPPMEEP